MIVLAVIVYVLGLILALVFSEAEEDEYIVVGFFAVLWPLVLAILVPGAVVFGTFWLLGAAGAKVNQKIKGT